MFRFFRRSIGRKLLAAVAFPSALAALAGILWLRQQTSHGDAEQELAFQVAIGGLALFAVLGSVAHAVAIRVLLERPLKRLAAAMQRTQGGDFLQRVEASGQDELADLARTFNATLAAITDLHVLRIDDAASLRAMERELELKAQLEARVQELELLHQLTEALAATMDLDARCRKVAELAAARSPAMPFALLLSDPVTGDLVVRSVAGIPVELVGQRLAAGSGLPGRAVREGKAVVGEAAALPREWRVPGEPPPAVVAMPMLHQDRCVGVMVQGLGSSTAFDETEARLMGSATRLVATSIENARLHQSMVRLSQTDNLTGVHNRRQFFARLEVERERATRFAEPFSLLLLDIDRFRELNEAVGHAAGDAVLREVAALLTREARAVDLVARSGGEEFAVVLPRTGADEAARIAERLRVAVAEAPFARAPGGKVTVSIGVAGFPSHTADLAMLVDSADAALFAAKRAGRNAVRSFQPGQGEDPARRRDVATTGQP